MRTKLKRTSWHIFIVLRTYKELPQTICFVFLLVYSSPERGDPAGQRLSSQAICFHVWHTPVVTVLVTLQEKHPKQNSAKQQQLLRLGNWRHLIRPVLCSSRWSLSHPCIQWTSFFCDVGRSSREWFMWFAHQLLLSSGVTSGSGVFPFYFNHSCWCPSREGPLFVHLSAITCTVTPITYLWGLVCKLSWLGSHNLSWLQLRHGQLTSCH